jgi:hypothetical protein
MADSRAQIVLDGDVGPLRQKLREAASYMQTFGKEAGASMDGLGLQTRALQATLAGLAGALSVGVYASFIKQQIDAQDAMSKSAQKAGVTTEQFSGMAYAAKLADVEVDLLTKSYAKLGALLTDAQQGQKEAVETFRRLKFDPKSFKDADELLLAVADRFAAMKDGAAKTAFAIDIFGERLGPGLIPFLNAGKSGLEELRVEAERLGVVVGTQTGKDAEEFNDTLTKMKTATAGVGMTMAKELLPALQAVASEMLRAKTEGGGAFESLGKAARVVVETVSILVANVSFVFKGIGREIAAIAAQGAALLRGDFGQIRIISEAVKEDGIRARKELDDLERRIRGLAGAAGGTSGNGTGTGTFVPDPKAPPKAAEQKAPGSLMQYYELALAEEKRLASEKDALREYTKEQELAYWQWLLNSTLIHGNDRVAISRKVAALEVEVRRKAAQDQQAVSAELARRDEALALGEVEARRAAARAALEAGQIDKAAALRQDVEFERERYEIQRKALEDRIQLLANDPNASPQARERLYSQLLELEQQYQTRRTELMGQFSVEKGKGVNSLASGIGDAFGDELEQTLMRAQTWQQAMGNIFQQTGMLFLREVVTKPASAYVASLARMLAVKLGFLGQEEVAQVASSSTVVGTKAAEANAVVTANAVEAGSGAAASQAPIPFVGPVLALAAMAAILAAVSGLKGGIKSARGGYDIPSGMSPMTQLHEEEMVLPKQYASVIRQLAEDGRPSSGAQVPIVINTSGGDWINKRDLAKILKAMDRNFTFVGSRS